MPLDLKKMNCVTETSFDCFDNFFENFEINEIFNYC